ncbi:hypothetical protein RhiJN_24212 [Ceratobasidium sp. AG-Ba]|nr:hypothetical protein RhiJN_24212 [Ceratobasidium sp. AG-Ba]
MIFVPRFVCAVVALGFCATSLIRVDDSEKYSNDLRYGIQYGPGWVQWNSHDPRDARYLGTYSSTTIGGSRLMFSFVGTGIAYYADKTTTSGNVLVAIDGDEYLSPTQVNSNTTEHRQLIWNVTGLAPGDHQIVIGTPANGSHLGVVGLDFFDVTAINGDIGYTPLSIGPGARQVPANATLVDDEDALIKYSGDSWQRSDIASSVPAPLFYNQTQHSSTRPGSSLSFTFNGTGVWYFSDDARGNANVSIVVDGHEPEIVSTSNGVTRISQRLFWSKTDLIDGEHVVTVTHVGKQGENASLDFFAYAPSPVISKARGENISITAVVGGIFGGTLSIGLLITALLFMRRRRHDSKAGVEEGKSGEAEVYHLELSKTTSRDSEATMAEEKINEAKCVA